MEQAEQVDPPVDAMLGPLWVQIDEDQRAALTDAWGAYASAATTSRGYSDETAALAKLFNDHHTPFRPPLPGPRPWFLLTVIPAPQRDGSHWWVTVEHHQHMTGDWGPGVDGLPPLPVSFCAHHVLEHDVTYQRSMFVTHQVILGGDLGISSQVSLWSQPDGAMSVTQEHLRSTPSLPVVLDRVVPALVKHSDVWDGTDADARKAARRLRPGHSERRGPARFELQRIADTYNSAGDQPMRAVQDRYGLTPSTARNRIREARRQGFVTRPAPKGGRPRKTGDQPR